MSTENKEPLRTITEVCFTGIGGWYHSLKSLKEDVDCAFNLFDDVEFTFEAYIDDAYVETSRQETEDEMKERIVLEEAQYQKDMDTINKLAAKHGIELKYE